MKTPESTKENTGAPDWEKIRAALAEPFPAEDIDWRVSRAGTKQGGGIWCTVLAYVNNRAVMDRLDEAVGIGGWEDAFSPGPQGGIMCGITINGVTKYDGAENTNIEAVKGGFSDSEKRAAVKWGIGRYLYKLTENFADVYPDRGNDRKYVKAKANASYPSGNYAAFYWSPPKLPGWALPKTPPTGTPVAEDAPPPVAKAKPAPPTAEQILKAVQKAPTFARLEEIEAGARNQDLWSDDLDNAMLDRKLALERQEEDHKNGNQP